jgi:hypothetical protein
MEILCREIIDSNNQNWENLEKLYNSLNKELEKAIPELNKFR